MIGAVGWTEERSKVMLLTDPIYYFSALLAQKTDTNYSTFADTMSTRQTQQQVQQPSYASPYDGPDFVLDNSKINN